jgi:hypothetical protein
MASFLSRIGERYAPQERLKVEGNTAVAIQSGVEAVAVCWSR